MTSRIETTDALTLLHELPSKWAQSLIAQPDRREAGCAPAILDESYRVLRDDGTLWLLLDPRENLTDYLGRAPWQRQPTPPWGGALTLNTARVRLHLLSKTPGFFYEHRPVRVPPATPTLGVPHCDASRRESETEQLARLIRRCILASSSPVACGACGAPYPRRDAASRRPGCAHNNPTGHCLVIDPFGASAALITQAAEQTGRHSLTGSSPAGIEALR